MDIRIIILIVALFNFGLALFVYSRGKKRLVNILFSLLSFTIGLWAVTLYLYGHPIIFSSLVWIKAAYFISLLLVFLTFYFSFVFPTRKIKNLITPLSLAIILAPFLLYLLFFTKLWIKDVVVQEGEVRTILGPFYFLAIIYSLIFICWSFYNLIKKYLLVHGIEKLQLKYLILGASLAGLGAGVADGVIPLITGSTRYFWTSPIFLLFFTVLTAFAILRYHLFEIRVILTEVLIGVMGLILLMLPFVMPTSFLKILTISAFLLFCIFGYVLIRGTYQEIERRESMEKLTQDLRIAYKDIKALSKMKTEFLKVASHQLRTPVSIIKGMLSMMEEGSVKGEKLKEYIRKSYLSSERLSTILDDILLAQGLVGGKEDVKLSSCQLEELIEGAVNHSKLIAKGKNLKIVFEKPKEPLPITLLDTAIIDRVVSRLIDNAILYTDRGKITVSLELKKEKEKNLIQISVKDSGVGLDKEDKKNLFKLFHRGEKATSLHPNGSGLGLFIVKNLIESHKGKVKAKSAGRSKGSTFIISIPLITEV